MLDPGAYAWTTGPGTNENAGEPPAEAEEAELLDPAAVEGSPQQTVH